MRSRAKSTASPTTAAPRTDPLRDHPDPPEPVTATGGPRSTVETGDTGDTVPGDRTGGGGESDLPTTTVLGALPHVQSENGRRAYRVRFDVDPRYDSLAAARRTTRVALADLGVEHPDCDTVLSELLTAVIEAAHDPRNFRPTSPGSAISVEIARRQREVTLTITGSGRTGATTRAADPLRDEIVARLAAFHDWQVLDGEHVVTASFDLGRTVGDRGTGVPDTDVDANGVTAHGGEQDCRGAIEPREDGDGWRRATPTLDEGDPAGLGG